MRVHRNRLRGLAALLGSVATAALGATLVLQPAASADIQPASGPESGPGLASGPEAPARTTVTFYPIGDSDTDSFNGPPAGIDCWLDVFNPAVPPLKPTKIEGAAEAECTWWMSSITVTVALFRGSNQVSSNTDVAIGDSFGVSTFGPCQGGAYYAAASAILVPPPGYLPPFRVYTGVSSVVPINGAGTAVPPFICKQSGSPSPTPTPTPPPSGLPVVNSLHCEYLGNNQFHCHLAASNWTQIRWTYNGNARSGWNNQTTVQGTCNGGFPQIAVSVSNSNGTRTAQDSFRCEGEPL